MSIFKQTFPKFVTEQLTKREEILSSGIDPLTGKHTDDITRSNNFYTYTLNKQCIIRLSSGVNLADDFEINGATGKQLAQRNVLQGGVQWNDIDKKSGGIGKPIEGGGYDGAYGSTAMMSDAKDGYGIVPMPGVVDAQIRTKSAYGSLREGKVKFVCHNKRQLEMLEILYMRPGYHLLLEWQWSPYIENDGTANYDLNFNSNFFEDETTMLSLEKEILKKKKDTGGNYDALIGYCKNFNYSVRPDGGFDCTTEIIAKGEVLESIKEGKDFRDKNGKKSSVDSDKPALETLLINLKYFHNPIDDNAKNGAAATTQTSSSVAEAITNPSGTDLDKQAQDITLDHIGVRGDVDLEYGWRGPNQGSWPWIVPKNHWMNLPAKGEDHNDTPSTIKGIHQSYVRWDAFCYALNKLAPEGESGNLLYEFHTYQIEGEDREDNCTITPLEYNRGWEFVAIDPYNLETQSPWPEVSSNPEVDPRKGDIIDLPAIDSSSNPNVCMFAHQFIAFVQTNEGTPSLYQGATHTLDMLKHDALWDLTAKRAVITPDLVPYKHRYAIGGIYLNPAFMLEKFRELYYDSNGNASKDYTLFKFIEAVWDGVNNCSQHHDFKLNTDNRPEGTICRIIDYNNVNGNELYGGVNLENVYELKILSPDSSVRNVTYNTTLPSALSSTIAIAAQSPDSIDDLDKVSFAALNKNTTDRFNKVKKIGASDEQRAKWNERFDEALEEYAMGLFIALKESGHYTTDKGNGPQYPGGTLSVMMRHWFFADHNTTGNLDEEKNDVAQQYLSTISKSQLKVHKAINILRNSYASTSDEAEGKNRYYRGQIVNQSPNQSSIIPLKFNAKMDGIGGIIIGNVFKLPKDKLPIGYQGDDIFFIVMGEEQTISAGQDWTTTISGHLILLGGKKFWDDDFNYSWSLDQRNISYKSKYLYATYTNSQGVVTSAAQQMAAGNATSGNTSAAGAKNTTIECSRLISGNKAKTNKRHNLPSEDTCETTTPDYVMKKLIPLLEADGIATALAVKIAAGFCGNISHESSYGASRYGDGGQSMGLCQWNKTRFDDLIAAYPNSWWTVDPQITHIMTELKGGGLTGSTYDYLKLCTNPKDCALIIVNRFERNQAYLDAHDADPPQYYTIEGYNGNVGKGMTLAYTSAAERASAAQAVYNRYVSLNPGTGKVETPKVYKGSAYIYVLNFVEQGTLKDTQNAFFIKDGGGDINNTYTDFYMRVAGESTELAGQWQDVLQDAGTYYTENRINSQNTKFVHYYESNAVGKYFAVGVEYVKPEVDMGKGVEDNSGDLDDPANNIDLMGK
tara:strand:- start:886 stop:4791 length:3906 start_codon:yes stop_codon:yes gene_type:complete